MTEQDKITIFDALIKPFLCSDTSMVSPDGNNLFALAIRQLTIIAYRAIRLPLSANLADKFYNTAHSESKQKKAGVTDGFSYARNNSREVI